MVKVVLAFDLKITGTRLVFRAEGSESGAVVGNKMADLLRKEILNAYLCGTSASTMM